MIARIFNFNFSIREDIVVQPGPSSADNIDSDLDNTNVESDLIEPNEEFEEVEYLEEIDESEEVEYVEEIESPAETHQSEEVPQTSRINVRGQHICKVCDKSFRYSSQLRIHTEGHGERYYGCTYPTCDRIYKHKKHLDDHMKFKHGFRK